MSSTLVSNDISMAHLKQHTLRDDIWFQNENHLKTKRVLYVANKNLCIYYTQINYFTAMDIETRVHQQVNAMSREQLQHQLIALLVKRETHRYKMAERARDASKKQAFSMASRRYYYKKNDIYHPELNPNGMIEKKFKNDSC